MRSDGGHLFEKAGSKRWHLSFSLSKQCRQRPTHRPGPRLTWHNAITSTRRHANRETQRYMVVGRGGRKGCGKGKTIKREDRPTQWTAPPRRCHAAQPPPRPQVQSPLPPAHSPSLSRTAQLWQRISRSQRAGEHTSPPRRGWRGGCRHAACRVEAHLPKESGALDAPHVASTNWPPRARWACVTHLLGG